MSSILEKLKKNSRIKETEILTNSEFFQKQDLTSTEAPMVNVALSGSLDGGLASGLTLLCGPSKHFKTSFALLIASAYLKKHKDAVILFYDSEFGSPQAYFHSFDIDTDRVLHTPIKTIEELKLDLVHQLDGMDKKDKVIIIIDSVGNLASKKELEDTLDDKSIHDMTRAKSLKGLFRMVTPYLTIKDVPLLGVNHTYQTQEMFSKAVVSGGTGIYYSASTIFIIGRRQEKVGTEVTGYHFVINIEKSRYVKEKSKIPISVSWAGGIEKYSGLLDLALEAKMIRKPSAQFCQLIDFKTGEFDENGPKIRPKAVPDSFYKELVAYQPFYDFIKNKYTIGLRSMISDDLAELEEDDTSNEVQGFEVDED
jgi:RecA/RadA recombinase